MTANAKSSVAWRLGVLAIASCSSSPPTGTIALLADDPADTFGRAPAPVTLVVEAVDAKGTTTPIATVALPASSATIDLGDVSTDTAGRVRVTGKDADGIVRVWGESLGVDFAALGDATLDVFVQRTGELARMPNPLSDARAAPRVGVLGGRFVVAAGGDATPTQSQIYDLADYAPLSSPPVLPRAPLSLAFAGTRGLLVDGAGATWFDFTDSSTTDAQPPSGGSFAEVAGGATLTTADGHSYVVGATRADGDPTARVLVVDATGSLSFVTLSAPRRGAAAAFVEGRGLVVAGGSATAAGVEVVGLGATNGIAIPYPPDDATSAGATPLDATHVLLAGGSSAAAMGGDPGLRVIDVGCSATCAAVPFGPSLAAPLSSADAFGLDAGSALVIGDDAQGATHAVRVAASPPSATEVPFKQARARARALRLDDGAIVVVGGGGAAIESFAP